MSAGHIYILSNVSMPGLLKVGRTDRSPETRAKELGTTGVPTPFKTEFSLPVADSRAAEARVHATLEATGCRVHPGREFFEISLGEAIDAVYAGIGEIRAEHFGAADNHSSLTTLYLAVSSLNMPAQGQEISESAAAKFSERLLEIARLGYPSAFRRAASLYFENCPSSMRFREYSQLYLRALLEDAESSVSMPDARYRDAGRMAGDYIIRLLERRWTVAGDFEFLVEFLKAAESARVGFKEVISNSKLPISLQTQMLSL